MNRSPDIAPGTRHDIGGRSLHLVRRGSGGPVVVIEPGAGGLALEWAPVCDRLAADCTAVVYDRAGYGHSDPDPEGPRTAERAIADLRTLLGAAGLAPPYLLVGHSMGAHLVRRYTQLHRAEVAGLVLVDPAHEDQNEHLPKELLDWWADAPAQPEPEPAAMRTMLAMMAPALDEDDRARLADWYADPRNAAAVRAETEGMTGLDERLRAEPELGDLPVVVLGQGDGQLFGMPEDVAAKVHAAWRYLHEQLAASSSRGRVRTAEGAGHLVHLTAPDAVADAVRDALAPAESPARSDNFTR